MGESGDRPSQPRQRGFDKLQEKEKAETEFNEYTLSYQRDFIAICG